MEEIKIFDIISNLLSGVKNNGRLEYNLNGEKIELTNCSYLLNQTIRQYAISRDHIFVSEKADALWKKITTDSIFHYTYRNRVVKNTDDAVAIDKYRGSEKKPYQKELSLCKGESFIYNDVFTDEHIVTVNNIIEELLELPNYDYEAIKKVLDKMYICKMLKEEDHNIKNKSRRSTDYREVIVYDYLDVGIKIKGFDVNEALRLMIAESKSQLESIEVEK